MAILDRNFFTGPDVVGISKALLGKRLFTRLPTGAPAQNGSSKAEITGGIIVETEAYAGITDRASHAYADRHTPRTHTMYMRGGVAYVYLCYGIHSLLNIVTADEGIPHAVLIRAILPTTGIRCMLQRKGLSHVSQRLTGGPGSLTVAMGIDRSLDNVSIAGAQIWIDDRGIQIDENDIVAAPRIGVAYAGPDASLPWRFFLKHNPWVSRS